MEFINYTPFLAIDWDALDAKGETAYHALLLQARFLLKPGEQAGEWNLAFDPDQGDLVKNVQYHGEPYRSSVRREFAFIPAKKQTDLILNATAFSPDNLPHPRWQCAIQVQTAQGEVRLKKALQMTGPRYWTRTLGIWGLTEPEPCTRVPLRYELAFGGELIEQGQDAPGDPWQATGFTGHRRDEDQSLTQGRYPAPRIEDPDDPITHAGRRYTPQGFGVIHSSWTPRRTSAQAAGTQADAGAPRNCAHPDLIVPGKYLNGDETLQLDHLLPGMGRQTAKLPGHRPLWRIRRQDGIDIYARLNLDTIELDMDTPQEAWRATLSWRAKIPNHLQGQRLEAILPKAKASTENKDKAREMRHGEQSHGEQSHG